MRPAYWKTLAPSVVVVLAAAVPAGAAEVVFQLSLGSDSSNGASPTYLGFPFLSETIPVNPPAISQRVYVFSPNNYHDGNLNGPYSAASLNWDTPEALENALTGMGSWTLRDYTDPVTPSDYTFDLSLNLPAGVGNLGQLLVGTEITGPLPGGSVSLDSPTFTWTGPTDFGSTYVTLSLMQSPFGTVASHTFAGSATQSWTPTVTLEPGKLYQLNVSSYVAIEGLTAGISELTPNSWSHTLAPQVSLFSSASAQFTAVPEPTALGGGLLCGAWALWRWRRNRGH